MFSVELSHDPKSWSDLQPISTKLETSPFENRWKSYENSQQAQKNISESQYKEKAKDVMKSNQFNLAESGIKQKNQKSSLPKIGPFFPILIHNFNPFILNYEMPNTINRVFDTNEF